MVYEVKTLWDTSVFRGTSDTQHAIICNLISNKHKNICVGVYWNDVGVPAESCEGD
jgi:hypothetical protein